MIEFSEFEYRYGVDAIRHEDKCSLFLFKRETHRGSTIGPAVRADFRRLYPANAKTPTCCPSDDNRTKVTNSVTSARSLWWHAGPYFWTADLTRTANPVSSMHLATAAAGQQN